MKTMAQSPEVRFYDAQYSQFGSRLYAEIRSRAFGQDIGQNGWLTAEEHDLFISWLDPAPGSSVLDIACGSGRTTLRIAQARGCTVFGVDMHEQGIAGATEAAMRLGLSERAFFRVADAARDLPYQDASFDALICNDAVNHLPDRAAVFREWLRVLKPGGRLVFTDPIVVTGPLTNAEIAIRYRSVFISSFQPGSTSDYWSKPASPPSTRTIAPKTWPERRRRGGSRVRPAQTSFDRSKARKRSLVSRRSWR